MKSLETWTNDRTNSDFYIEDYLNNIGEIMFYVFIRFGGVNHNGSWSPMLKLTRERAKEQIWSFREACKRTGQHWIPQEEVIRK